MKEVQVEDLTDAWNVKHVAKDLPGRWYPIGGPWLGDFGSGAMSADAQVIPGCTRNLLAAEYASTATITY